MYFVADSIVSPNSSLLLRCDSSFCRVKNNHSDRSGHAFDVNFLFTLATKRLLRLVVLLRLVDDDDTMGFSFLLIVLRLIVLNLSVSQ